MISGKLANGEAFRTTAPSDAQVTELSAVASVASSASLFRKVLPFGLWRPSSRHRARTGIVTAGTVGG